jgi:2',3'-cyclic-nucleotide 2'-phosphodiesterase (5'-nucleotidase family)
MRVEDTIIAQAGYWGIYLGVLNLQYDGLKKRTWYEDTKSGLKTIYAAPGAVVQQTVAGMVETYNERIKAEFSKTIGETTPDLLRSLEAESNLGNLITDAMREASGADIAFQNSGGIRADIPRGRINLEQIYTTLPFDNLLLQMELTGAQIMELLEQSIARKRGILQVSGLKVVYDPSKPDASKVKSVLVGEDEPLDPQRYYKVATNDFLAAGGDGYHAFKEGKNLIYGGFLRDIFTDYVSKHSPVNPQLEGRISFAQ